jgi:hypothetical protein
MTDKELVERLLDFDKVTVGDARDAALRIEALTAKLAKAVEGLREIAGECGCSTARAMLAEIEGKEP